MSEYIPIIDAENPEESLFWTGPLMLGAPDVPPYNAYASVIRDVSIDDRGFAILASSLAKGVQAEEELRALRPSSISRGDSLGAVFDDKIIEIEKGRRAKEALIARHLALVLEVAEGCLRRVDKAEIVGVGNLALTAFVCEDYAPDSPDSVEERQRFQRLALKAIMSSLVGYGPRYQGKSIDALEKMWSSEAVKAS